MFERAIERGVSFLADRQQPDGGFLSVFWEPGQPEIPADGLFVTASILLAAAQLLPAEMRDRAVAFLLRRRLGNGLWHFHSLPRHLPLLPPDADSTACCLAALARTGNVGRDDAALLRLFWRPGAGPFRTWLGDGSWNDPRFDDAVVNCNVLFALRALGDAPSVSEWCAVHQLAIQSSSGTPFYPSFQALMYAACRAGVFLVSEKTESRSMSCLEAAQCLTASGGRDGTLVKAVLAGQLPEGGWKVEPLYKDAQGVYGSAELSTAIAMEALAISKETKTGEENEHSHNRTGTGADRSLSHAYRCPHAGAAGG